MKTNEHGKWIQQLLDDAKTNIKLNGKSEQRFLKKVKLEAPLNRLLVLLRRIKNIICTPIL